MILIDANILIYAHVSSFPQHDVARDWLDRQLNGLARVGLPWPSLPAFLRLVTNPRVFEHAEPIDDAWDQVLAWLACDPTWVPKPTERHAELLGPFSPYRAPRQSRARRPSGGAGDGARADLVLDRWRFRSLSPLALSEPARRVGFVADRSVAPAAGRSRREDWRAPASEAGRDFL